MSVVSITNAKNAKSAGVIRYTETKRASAFFAKAIEIVKATWPRKTSAHVAHLTGVSERAVQFWLAGETRMSLDGAIALLQTDAGFEILEAIMGDAKVEWWVVTQVAQDVRKSKKAIKKEQERINRTRAQLDLLDQ